MKKLLTLSALMFSGALLALQLQYPEIRLSPGQKSDVMYDYASGQYVQVRCEGFQQPPPPPYQPPPPVMQSCSLKYNTGSCGAYQVFKGGQPAAACTASMDAAISQMRSLIANRNCSEPRPVGCDVKFNTGFCGGYQVYAYTEVISQCFAGLDQAQSVLSTLRANNLCM